MKPLFSPHNTETQGQSVAALRPKAAPTYRTHTPKGQVLSEDHDRSRFKRLFQVKP